MNEMRSKGLKVCCFISAIMHIANLTIYMETVLSCFVDVSAQRYVQ